ncbi:hypothetical protein JHW43_000085 [Diplocarpon mali]|nr:hypothetical protein JHW43_000085 [Diplocarpon mali]
MRRPAKRQKGDASSNPRFSYASPDYKHEPLPTTTSIRILELCPGEGPDLVRCSLLVSERQNAPSYEAISYAWGSSAQTRVICCENQKLRVTTNLRDALWKIRDPGKPRLLWADAVCINQNDTKERGDQVCQMAEIYANATRVLVWLSLPSPRVVDFDYLFGRDLAAAMESSNVSTGQRPGLLQKFVGMVDADTKLENFDSVMKLVAHNLSQVLDSPWFTRLWVVQEVGMAKSVLALIGNATLDFVDLVRIILKLERRTLLMDQLGLLTAGIANVFTTFPARFKELPGEVDSDYDFLELLEVTRAHKASDSRDYIYALLGHPSARVHGEPLAVPDYKKTPEDLFFQVSVRILEQTNDLRLLSAIQARDDGKLNETRASWTPSWTRESGVLSMGLYRDRYYSVLYDACAGRSADLQVVRSQKVLRVQGFVFDRVDEYTPTETTNEKTGDRHQKGVEDLIISLLDFETPKTSSFGSSTPLRLTDVGQTITAGFRNQNLAKFDADFAAFRIHMIDQAVTTSEREALTSMLAPKGLEELQQLATSGALDEIYWATSRFCTGRKLFSTRDGRTGLGPEVLRRGDLCCILFGACVPIILRRAEAGYTLVGEAYVHGVMKGEAMTDLSTGGRYEEQTFAII